MPQWRSFGKALGVGSGGTRTGALAVGEAQKHVSLRQTQSLHTHANFIHTFYLNLWLDLLLEEALLWDDWYFFLLGGLERVLAIFVLDPGIAEPQENKSTNKVKKCKNPLKGSVWVLFYVDKNRQEAFFWVGSPVLNRHHRHAAWKRSFPVWSKVQHSAVCISRVKGICMETSCSEKYPYKKMEETPA